MDDDKLALDEARRAAQHEAVKSQVEGDVQAEITQRAAESSAPGETHRIDQVAGEFRSKAVNEVVDYIFYVIYALMGMRFLLALLAARSTAGFVRFIVAVTNPFYAPFKGIVASPSTDQGHTLLLPVLIAIVAYILLHLGINGLLRMLAHRKTQI